MPPDDTHDSNSDSTNLSRGTRRKRRWRLATLTAAVVTVGGAIFARFADRVDAEEKLARTTSEAAVPSVTVIHPQAGAPNQEIMLPGYAQAFTDTPVYARTSGYLKVWHFDIGAHVRKGDLLAEIDTPEVDQQLRQARADLATAQANLQLAEITAKRNEDLLKTRAVSTQDRDNANGALAADKAIVRSNDGNVARLAQLQSYEKVYASFDGIITARSTDIGALIDADANSPSKELFHLAAIDTLRVYVAVPEQYSSAAQVGATASLTLDEFPGESFQGRLVRNANAIDLSSRTLLVEVDVDNPASRLLPGAYTSVHLSLPSTVQSATVPANTLLFRKEGLRTAVVRNGHAQLAPVTIGRDYGEKVEILSGLQPTDEVIVDPSDSLISGTVVRIADSKSE
ncbi:MAG: efflux transporter periplasmic adaptor subunit [Gammaproteobacteria bacterium]|jgi:RND family efflux transporter MFP subunit|nr:efflux transporter periplasmic adaptor subunit [Gammaproteobacteria bacterium]